MAQAIKRIEETQEAEGLELEVRDRLGREHRRRARLERHRAMALRDGEDLPAWSPVDLKTLADADRKEASIAKGQRGAPAVREAARRERDRVAAERKARAEARAGELRLAETVRLEAAREGVAEADVLERKRGQAKPRLKTRDGLKMLHESGALTPATGTAMERRIVADRRMAVGLRFRDRYEVAQASLKSCLNMEGQQRRPATLWTQAKIASRRAALVNAVRVLEVRVQMALGEEALLALRMIAGEARTVRSLGGGATRRARLARLLARALDIVGEKLANPS